MDSRNIRRAFIIPLYNISKESAIGCITPNNSEEPYDYVRAVLHKYKSILSNLTLDEIRKIDGQEIGEPDYILFPMFKKEENNQKK